MNTNLRVTNQRSTGASMGYVRRAAVCLVVGMTASVAMGQGQPALKGPEVKDREVPGVVPEFGGASTGGQRRFAERLPIDAFRKALGVLTAPDAPEAIRASDEQRVQFRTLAGEFEKRVREYRRTHGKEIEELRKLLNENAGERGGKGEKRPSGESMESMDSMTEATQKKRDEVRIRLRELEAGMPQVSEVQTKVWAGLNEAQRAAVDAELKVFREEQAKQREEQYVRQRVKKVEGEEKSDAKPAKGNSEEMKPGEGEKGSVAKGKQIQIEKGKGDDRGAGARRERLIRWWNQLTPDEQERALERMEAMRAERDGAKREENGKRGGGGKETKPVPDVEGVKVPSPEEKK